MSAIALPFLVNVMRISGRGSDFGYVRLDPGQQAAFDLGDSWVMQTPALSERIAAENELSNRA